MNTLNVLLVTYGFPPVGGVGVLRAASLARYFPSEGIRLDVLTARNASAVGADPTLLQEIPSQVNVHRTVTLDIPFGIKKGIKRLVTGRKPPMVQVSESAAAGKSALLKRILGDVLLPDPQVTWLPVLTRAARRIVGEHDIDLVLITVPPFSSVLLVQKLRKRFPRLSIVVDFRDEWLSTIDLASFSSSERARRTARDAEESAVKNASTVVAVTEGARREIRARYPEEPESKFRFIPNGFDATRLHIAELSPNPGLDRRIVVTYVGTVYPSTDPTFLVKALQSLPTEIKSKFKLRFIGHIEEPRYRDALLQLDNMVELKGYLPQHEALAAIKETDYVLLITHDRLNVSAKFYDYIGSGKPILGCIHPEGDVRLLLEKLRAGWWADGRDVAGIRQLFLEVAGRGSSLLREFHPDKEKIAQFERRVIARRYAALLHSIAGREHMSGSNALAAQPAGTEE
jgi:glycosyltransferase involved in cell wall biosynthesis